MLRAEAMTGRLDPGYKLQGRGRGWAALTVLRPELRLLQSLLHGGLELEGYEVNIRRTE